MNAQKLLALAALGCLIVAADARSDEKPDYVKLIVGKWEVSQADPGTVPDGTLIEFTKDGKMKATVKKGEEGTTIEGTYKVEKDTFVMTVKVGDQERTQTISITKISDKEMTTKDKDGKVVELKKVK